MRSIIFALGISCLILGVQSLVVDHVVLKDQSALRRLKLASSQQTQMQQVALQQARTQSLQLDPNYYNGPFSNNAAILGYGNGPSNQGVNPFQLTGYNQASPRSLTDGLVSQVGARRIFKPKDWMPWGLFAGGIVLVMLSRRSGD